MKILIIILIYVSGWYAARWMNRKVSPLDPLVGIWFLSWISVLPLLMVWLGQQDFKWPDWIKGKGWDEE